MKQNKIAGFAAGMLTMLAAALPFAGRAQDYGMIHSVIPVATSGHGLVTKTGGGGATTWWEYDTPVRPGGTMRFIIRVLNRFDGDDFQKTDASQCAHWVMRHAGYGSEELDAAQFPMRIGLWVGNRLEFADIMRCGPASTHYGNLPLPDEYGVDKIFTDIECEYRVQGGDFALPVRFANREGTGPITFTDGTDPKALELCVQNADKWELRCPDISTPVPDDWCGEKVSFRFAPMSSSEYATVHPGWAAWKEQRGQYEVADWDLSKANMRAEGAGFDKTYADEAQAVWRKIAANSYTATPMLPTLQIEQQNVEGSGAVVQDARRYYVWTDDETVLEIDGAVAREGYYGETTAAGRTTKKVREILVAAGIASVTFRVKGLVENQEAYVYLSSNPEHTYNGAGDKINDYDRRKIRVTAPPPPTVTVGVTPRDVEASGGFATPVASVLVSISEPHSDAITVKLDAQLMKDPAEEGSAREFISLSTQAGDGHLDKLWQVTIPEGETEAELLYMYALGASAETYGSAGGIRIVPSCETTDPGSSFLQVWTPGVAKIKPAKPVIMDPAENDEFLNLPGGTPVEFSVEVSDAYLEVQNGKKYQVTWSDKGGTRTINDVEMQNNRLRFPVTFGDSGSYAATFTVRNESGQTSAPRKVTVGIQEARRLTCEETVGKLRRFEGEEFDVRFKLSFTAGWDEPRYAFLLPLDEASSNLVECVQFTTGVPIVKGDTESQMTAVIRTLDGSALTAGLQYTVKLLDKPKIDDPAAVEETGIVMPRLVLTVDNKAPAVSRVAMAGSKPVTTNNATIRGAIIDTPKVFTFGINDVPADQTNEVTVTYSFSREGIMETPETTVSGLLREIEVTNTFASAGTYEGTVSITDKDGGKSEDFTFFVEVGDTPTVEVTPANGSVEMRETDVGQILGRFQVRLSSPCTESDLGVKLEVIRNGAGNYPLPTLNTDSITFRKSATEASFYVTAADGTLGSAADGFTITATVTNENANIDGKMLKDVYIPGGSLYMVQNVNPAINRGQTVMTDEEGNALPVPATKDVPVTIAWNVSDVAPDLAEGLTVTWTSSEGKTETISPDANGNVVSGGNYVYTFTSASKNHWLTLTVTDKDGGMAMRTWRYEISTSKSLMLYPRGPASGAIGLGAYANQPGMGQGRVVADGSIGTVVNFGQEWTYPVASSAAKAYAWGYRVGDTDDGTLSAATDLGLSTVDVPVGPDGKRLNPGGTSDDYYAYNPTDGLDSFFYTWLITPLDEEGKTGAPQIQGTLMPYTPGAHEHGAVSVGLTPPDDNNNNDNIGSQMYWAIRQMEAVFSKELYPEDNIGDLNGDGIPDVFALKAWSTQYPLYKFAALPREQRLSGSVSGGGSGSGTGGGNSGSSNAANSREHDFTDVINLNNNQGDVSNPDEDYLPAKTAMGGKLIPNIQSTWVNPELKFTTRMEIRGFHDGLNYQMENDGLNYNVRGKWISDPCFSPAETCAWFVAWCKWEGNTNDVNNRTWGTFCTNEVSDVGTVEGAKDVLTKMKWSPENRTDPTNPDTDGDELPDGYEYWYWYHATVGWMTSTNSAPCPTNNWTQLYGVRFSLADPASGTIITPEEIAAAFNPTKARTPEEMMGDLDGDGLTDYEEYLIGTNPIHWDTDGDGFSDLWEVMNGLNPLVYDESEVNPDGDFMASCRVNDPETELPYTVFRVKYFDENGVTTNQWEFATTMSADALPTHDGTAWSGETALSVVPVFRYGGEPTVPDCLIACSNAWNVTGEWVPRKIGSFEKDMTKIVGGREGRKQALVKNMPALGTAWKLGVKPLDRETFDVSEANAIEVLEEGAQLRLIHEQVLRQYGFDPRCAWADTSSDVVNARWKGKDGYSMLKDSAGAIQNTEPYTTRDEYLLAKYRMETAAGEFKPEEVLKRRAAAAKEGVAGMLMANTTIPGVPVTGRIYGDYHGYEFGRPQHGADSSGDGVPDGWVLYMGKDPLASVGGSSDDDEDELSFAEEFAGTDSCVTYLTATSYVAIVQDMPLTNAVSLLDPQYYEPKGTIYANHPGLGKGWWNKFWPTDPYDMDTDGDGLSDSDEGDSWTGKFYDTGTGEWKDWKFSFIYGTAVDDGSICIRGGGLNPCAVDTDGDLLPDAWERQFAGVVNQVEEWVSEAIIGETTTNITVGCGLSTLSKQMVETFRRLDGVTTVEFPNIYIVGGMDGTFGPFCYGGMPEAGDSAKWGWDPLAAEFGRFRNFDFDQDGLANWQEYLTQTLRHLRYDDSETPLMGGYLPNGAGNRKHLKFIKMNHRGGFEMAAEAQMAGFTGAAMFGEGSSKAFNYAELGYFTNPTPIRDFDPLWHDARGAFKVLLPPHGRDQITGMQSRMMTMGGYASTDPRMHDTDLDGMDDYYEVFHGLNPILGNRDIIAENSELAPYPPQVTHVANAWTGWSELAEPDSMFDAIKYPWMMGLPEADADGDGLRNLDEALISNMPAPQNYHTDPTPLWMTDFTSKSLASYTTQYYMPYSLVAGFEPWFAVGEYYDPKTKEDYLKNSKLRDSVFPFEENEGYDTDGDWVPDNFELIPSVTVASDPLDFTDPDRRQAIWFPGNESGVISRENTLNRYVAENYALFRQFTVEMWIKPEDVNREQVILERMCEYGPSTLSNNVSKVRANFRVGIDANGFLYGMYENSNAVDSGSLNSMAKVGEVKLEADKWTHVALSYDGKRLRLYLNGEVARYADSELIPANGIVITEQIVSPGAENIAGGAAGALVSGTATNGAILNVTAFPGTAIWANGYSRLPSALLMGMTARNPAALSLDKDSAWGNYGSFYKGWLDEVRIWDGARTATQIRENAERRFSADDVKAARDAVWAAWSGSNQYYLNAEDEPPFATRNENDGLPMLPAELIFHYNFSTLPSATEPGDAAREPTGFTRYVLDNVRADGLRLNNALVCGWWGEMPLASMVYNNRHIVPWIRNTCSHLPAMNGTVTDSQYWSEKLAGATLIDELPGSTFSFPNSMNPYGLVNFLDELLDRERMLAHHYRSFRGTAFGSTLRDLWWRTKFDLRSSFAGTADLVPLGGAFAKRSADYWDKYAAMDAWTNTRLDLDGDELPDWWERLYGNPKEIAPDTLVTWEGAEMTAREAYLRDRTMGMLPTAASKTDRNEAFDMSKLDRKGDGLPDWWQELYGLNGYGALDDADGDQLSNYAEFLISEGFAKEGFPKVEVNRKRTFQNDGQVVTDYFLKCGKLYLGEMFADHDFMEDAWEDMWDPDYVSRFKFDPWDDPDNDGWSNFAECRAGTNPTVQNDLGAQIGNTGPGYTMPQHPEPLVRLKLRYNGISTMDKPLIVQAYSDISTIPDAIWECGIGSGKNMEHYLGYNTGKKVQMNLGPAAVVQGSVRIQFKCGYWRLWTEEHGWEERFADTSSWFDVIRDRGDTSTGDPNKGELFVVVQGYENYRFTRKQVVIGKIDYATGEMEFDYSGVPSEWMPDEDTRLYLTGAFARVSWLSQPPSGNTEYVLRLSRPNQAQAGVSKGALREGKNTFVAFLDLDGNGKWTAGEPFGVACNVDTGWNSASCEIELTETSPSIIRANWNELLNARDFATANGATDRGQNFAYYPNFAPAHSTTNAFTTDRVRVRIMRSLINDKDLVSQNGKLWYSKTVLFDEIVDMAHAPMLSEGNVYGNKFGNEYDLDWGNLRSELEEGGDDYGNVSNITYRIVVDSSTENNLVPNQLLPMVFVNAFEPGKKQTKAEPLTPGGTIYTGNPTFTWKHDALDERGNKVKDYPAFRLRVWDEQGAKLVYDSGPQLAPPRDGAGNYSWTAPIYANMPTPQGVTFMTTNNYKWAVSMLDAKFMEPNADETKMGFRLETSGRLGTISDYGLIEAKVKYFGPATANADPANLKNLIRVQAFATPDFTGQPAGEGYVTNVTELASSDKLEINALILGVKPGTYYLRAFLDLNGDGQWQREESWGYGNYAGTDDSVTASVERGQGMESKTVRAYDFCYTPRPYKVEAGKPQPVAEIFMEDCDTDNDGLPDAWELQQYGTLGERSSPSGTTFFTKVNPELLEALPGRAYLSGLGETKHYAAMTLMNAILNESPEALVAAMTLLGSAPAAEAEELPGETVTLRIAEFSAEKGIEIEVESEVKGGGTRLVTVDSVAKAGVWLEASETVDFAESAETLVDTVEIRANETGRFAIAPEKIEAAKKQAGGASMFFRVKIKQAK